MFSGLSNAAIALIVPQHAKMFSRTFKTLQRTGRFPSFASFEKMINLPNQKRIAQRSPRTHDSIGAGLL
jgi:hypothetical protein